MENPNAQSRCYATFYTDAIQLGFESEKQGRPIFQDVPFIRILVPGDTTNIIEREANDQDKIKYRKEWQHFEAGQTAGLTGTPLEQWPQITRSQLKEAKYFEVHTVEQMAGLADIHAQKLGMGFYELRNKAKAYLDAASGTADSTKQAAENLRLTNMLADLQKQVAELSEASEAKKAGRPKKEPETA